VAHQKTAKFCLEIQGKNDKNFECEYCCKKFTQNQSLIDHFNVCKEKCKKEYAKQFDAENFQLKERLREREEYIAKLEAKLEKFEDAVIASKKPTNTTNNNTNNIVVSTLNLNDTERFKSIIHEKMTKNVVCNGQRGLAKFAVENLLKDSEGKLMYKCVDPSRHNFEFTNSDGIVEKDVRAIKLKRALIEGDVIVTAKNAGNELWTRADGSTDSDRYSASSAKVIEIMTVDRDDTKFRTELSALTS
jgi:predicted RNase H-like nuclease (RuvC/YqgF family)